MKEQFIKRSWCWVMLALAGLAGSACRSSAPASPTGPPSARTITVSAAASLQAAFREIGQQYEARTNTRINFNFGASGALQKQIEAGAPVDVFASAGQAQMEALASQALILPESQRDFARNTLVLITPANQTATLKDFADLTGATIKRLAVGNPKTVPAGQYAQQALTRLGLWQQLQPRLVLAEDVRQVFDYVARGEVEAGLVYASDVRADDSRVRVGTRAPADAHDPILYPIAIVRASQQQAAAQAFIDAVASDQGQNILEKYGFARAR
jgi:molybdate transport system substrate-binding protein